MWRHVEVTKILHTSHKRKAKKKKKEVAKIANHRIGDALTGIVAAAEA